jgi:hypothetical protein
MGGQQYTGGSTPPTGTGLSSGAIPLSSNAVRYGNALSTYRKAKK